MTIGERIKKRRLELNMTQEQLANKLGYKSKSSINKIEMDSRNLTQPKIKLIADALKTTPEYIMGWNEVPNSGQKKQYYEDAKMVQEMFEDADMRSLFHMKKNMGEEKFSAHVRYMKDLYRLEHPEEEDFY